MAGRQFGAVVRRIERLFAVGSVAGLSEGQLLERFATVGDEAAFEALLARHGPMVLGICRQVLRDPNDVEDAFQATFLVLVRKAGTLRDRDWWATGSSASPRGSPCGARAAARRRQSRPRETPARGDVRCAAMPTRRPRVAAMRSTKRSGGSPRSIGSRSCSATSKA